MNLSIILPVYNNEKTIKRCLDSLINQDFEGEYEVIVVDDGSLDRTPEIIRQTIQDKKNISFYRLEHEGRVKAKSFGLSKAKGEYIYIAEADAYYSRDCMQKCFQLAASGKVIPLPRRRVWGRLKSMPERAFDFYFRAREDAGFKGFDEIRGGWLYPRDFLIRIYGEKKFTVFDDVEVAEEAKKEGYELKICEGRWWHLEPNSLKELFDRNVFYGRRLKEYLGTRKKSFGRFLLSIALNFGILISLLYGIFTGNYYVFILLMLVFLLRNKSFLLYGIKKRRIIDMILFLSVYRYTALAGTLTGLFISLVRSDNSADGK